jgi:hypothetical protein
MEQKKDKLEKQVLCYLGKTLSGQGKTKEGKEWTKWKLEFKKGDYNWKCYAFNSLSAKGVVVKELEEGKYYEVLYKVQEYTHPEYGIIKSKQAVLIKSSEPQYSTEEDYKMKQSTLDESSINLMKEQIKGLFSGELALKEWDNFVVEYNEAMEGNPKKCEMHMIGTYIVNFHEKQCKQIIDKCNGNF